MAIDRTKYPDDWDRISYLIRAGRADWCCEWCGVHHGEQHPVTGATVMLTVHHRGIAKPDGTPGDRRDKMDCRGENLVALCQRCHLAADRDLHVESARRTKWLKKYGTPAEQEAAGQLKLKI